MIDAILAIRAETLHGDAKFGAEVQQAMRLLRSDVMNGRCELPSWLTAHLDTCEKCGAEKVWKFKPFSTNVWEDGNGNGQSGQGFHGCLICSGGVI